MFVQRYYHLFNYKFLNSVYRSQILFCVVVVTYVLFNMFTSPMDLVRLSGEYSQTHRFIGFTGHLYENSKITRIGNTSVAMGTYASLLFFISFFKFLRVPSFLDFQFQYYFYLCTPNLLKKRDCLLGYRPFVSLYGEFPTEIGIEVLFVLCSFRIFLCHINGL